MCRRASMPPQEFRYCIRPVVAPSSGTFALAFEGLPGIHRGRSEHAKHTASHCLVERHCRARDRRCVRRPHRLRHPPFASDQEQSESRPQAPGSSKQRRIGNLHTYFHGTFARRNPSFRVRDRGRVRQSAQRAELGLRPVSPALLAPPPSHKSGRLRHFSKGVVSISDKF